MSLFFCAKALKLSNYWCHEINKCGCAGIQTSYPGRHIREGLLVLSLSCFKGRFLGLQFSMLCFQAIDFVLESLHLGGVDTIILQWTGQHCILATHQSTDLGQKLGIALLPFTGLFFQAR